MMWREAALITGASSGVGAALASKLSAMGARVVVNYSRSAEAAEAVVAQVTGAGTRLRYRPMFQKRPTVSG